mgnify:CR=1 FL=1
MANEDLLFRQMPHDLEGEQAVLGAMLIDPSKVKEVLLKLRPEDFYLQQNDLVYVEPNRVRAEASTQNQFTNVGTWLSLISFLMSTCVLIFK